jgi:hypothetical protein
MSTMIAVLLALLLLATGGGKLLGATSSHLIRDSLGLSPIIWRAIGIVEMVLVIGLLMGFAWPDVARITLVGVCLLMIGALAARLRAGGMAQRNGIIADVVILSLAALALGLAV